jgi:hypothetical protein
MYDFETLGQTPDTKVVSLGAVAFNRDGILAKKYWVFDWEAQPGRTEDSETVAWWNKQSPEARIVFDTPKEKRISIEDFLLQNDSWIQGLCFELGESRNPKTGQWKELKPMSNGANFDLVIIEDMYRKNHPKGKAAVPWAFWNTYCFRTIDHLHKIKDLMAKNTVGQTIVKHNALEDAIWQTKCVLELWKRQDALKKARGL